MTVPLKIAVTNGNEASIRLEKEILKPWNIQYVTGSCRTVNDTIELCRDADIILATSAPVNAEVIAQLLHCKMILRFGIGVDTIDLEAAAARHIPVVNVPDYGVKVVADHTMALMLASVRKITQVAAHVKEGGWSFPGLAPIMELEGKVVGLVGFGNIARAVARRAQAFDMHVIAYDPYVQDDQFMELGVENVDWDSLLQRSDIVSVHLPLTEQTRHWIHRDSLRIMKPGSYLINTSRGGVVDTEALAEALEQGWIAGAGLDVLEQEPVTKDNPLLAHPQCIITSHCAAYSVESIQRLHEYAGLEIARLLRGERPKHIVNGVEPDLIPVPIHQVEG